MKYILENWTREQGLQALPVFALGVSAGASFCLKLPKITRINGVISGAPGSPAIGNLPRCAYCCCPAARTLWAAAVLSQSLVGRMRQVVKSS